MLGHPMELSPANTSILLPPLACLLPILSPHQKISSLPHYCLTVLATTEWWPAIHLQALVQHRLMRGHLQDWAVGNPHKCAL